MRLQLKPSLMVALDLPLVSRNTILVWNVDGRWGDEDAVVAEEFRPGQDIEVCVLPRWSKSVAELLCSLHIMLSVMKDDSFVCRDAMIRTRDLEYRNQTWSVSTTAALARAFR